MNSVSSSKPSPDQEESSVGKTKPNAPPSSDKFRKLSKEGRPPSQEEMELAPEEQEDSKSPSLFDLSKSSRPKGKKSSSMAQSQQQTPVSSRNPSSRLKEPSADQNLGSVDEEAPQMAMEEMPENEAKVSEEPPRPQLPKGKTTKTSAESSLENTKTRQSTKPTMNQQQKAPIDEREAAESSFDVDASIDTEQPDSTQSEVPAFNPQQATPKRSTDVGQPIDEVTRHQQAVSNQPQQIREKDSTTNRGTDFVEAKKDKKSGTTSQKANSVDDAADRPNNLSGINTAMPSSGFNTDKPQIQEAPINRSATIQQLVNQIVDRVQVLRREDRTETIVTLRHPPILEGATLTLTANDNAKREFNISFASLSPEAKQFLDRVLREDSLTQRLETKGIIVHMVTTTTQAENPIMAQESGQSRGDQDEQQRQQQRQQQEEQEKEET